MRSGNGGPCQHCGRTSSPCWRKGPPDKPVLCNACGARFLVKKTLEGYVPSGPRSSSDYRAPKMPYAPSFTGQAGSIFSAAHARNAKFAHPQGQQPVKRKRSAPRYEVDDLYVREPRSEYKPSKAPPSEVKRVGETMPADSSASSLTKEQSEEKSTLESNSKRLQLHYVESHLGLKVDVNNAAASATMTLVQMQGLDGFVTAVRRPRKQLHPRACPIH